MRRKVKPFMTSLSFITVIGAGLFAAEPGTTGALRTSDPAAWSQWRGPNRDGIAREKGLLRAWPKEGPPLLWKTSGLGRGWSSPVFGDGRIYITGDVGDSLFIYALDESGRTVWRTTNGRSWRGSYPGARAACTFYKGNLYNLNAHGRLVCLDARNGAEKWSVNILERFGGRSITWGLSECVLVERGYVVVTPGGSLALMAALDAETGRTLWKTPPIAGDRASHASPIVFSYSGKRLISNCSAHHGFGVDADTGRLLWTVPLRNAFGVNVATPVYSSGCVYYVTPYAELGRCWRLVPKEGAFDPQLKWVVPLDTVTGCSILTGGTLYAARYKQRKWWFAVDWKTGKIAAELRSLTTGSAVYADGRLYCFDEKGTVALVTPLAEGFQVISSFKLPGRRIRDAWAHPVVYRGRLYVRYHDTLSCYDVQKGSK